MNGVQRTPATLTQEAARLVESGADDAQLKPLELEAIALTEQRLMTMAQLDDFFRLTGQVTGTTLALKTLIVLAPSVEGERMEYIYRQNRARNRIGSGPQKRSWSR